MRRFFRLFLWWMLVVSLPVQALAVSLNVPCLQAMPDALAHSLPQSLPHSLPHSLPIAPLPQSSSPMPAGHHAVMQEERGTAPAVVGGAHASATDHQHAGSHRMTGDADAEMIARAGLHGTGAGAPCLGAGHADHGSCCANACAVGATAPQLAGLGFPMLPLLRVAPLPEQTPWLGYIPPLLERPPRA